MTKGKMINALKAIGVRKGDKEGFTVCLEQLKTHQVVNLYFKYFKTQGSVDQFNGKTRAL